MSLILDALRKADAERERGAVPGLHAQPVPPLSVEPSAPAQSRPVLWIVIGATVGLASAFGVYFASREQPPPSSPAAAEASAPTVQPAAPRTTPSGPAPVAVPAPWPAKETRSAASGPAMSSPGARAGSPAQVVAKAAPPAPPPIPREQLPAELRSELPPLVVGGSMYSATPAHRTLIIDGRLYREGESIAAGLTLEEIRLKSAVLGYKGHRFEIRF